ncbi:hypothetical protein ABN303_09260 [Providencia rettgeri]
MREVKPTQKPVPSSDIKDLFFNSGLLDIWATSLEHKYIDRFGNCHLTAAGMEWIFNELVTKFKIESEQALLAAGYAPSGTFQEGAEVVSRNGTVLWKLPDGDGDHYRWDGDLPKQVPAGSTPQSTGGIGKGAWVSVGDASLRGGLSANDGAKLIGVESGGSLFENINATTIEQKGAEQSKEENVAEIQSAVSDATFGRTLIAKTGVYHIKSAISLQDRREFVGSGEASVIKWDGGNGSPENQLSIINAKKANPATAAIANTKLREMMIDMNDAENVVAVNAQYLSVQSLFEGVRVQNPGAGSIGFYLSKSWYASMNRLSVRGVEPNRTGTGLYIDTKVGQVNSVPINIQCSALDAGVVLDTRNNYMYDIRLTGQIEKCNVGLRHIARRGLRTATISMYFEENKVADVIWGQENEEAGTGYVEQSQQVIWDGCTFNPNNSKVILWEGRHWFRAIDRLKTLEINGNARVRIDGGSGISIVNNTGLPLNQVVVYSPTPTYRPATNNSAIGGDTQYILGHQFNATSASGSASFDVSKVFNSIGTNGQNAKFDVLIRRTYENNSPLCYSGFIQVNSSGEFGLYVLSKTSSASYIEPAIDTFGVLTLKDNRAGSSVYSLMVVPN